VGEPIIELTDLTKKYGEYTAVDHLTLTVNRGEIFGLLGPNGAGKSTTILMMLGLSEPTSGKVRVCNIDSTRQPIQVKKKVGYLPDDVGFYEDRSGLDNLMYTARLNRISERQAREKAERLLERVGLSDAAEKKAGTYSRGMRQRLGLADVLIKDPEVIILDEPTLGIDPQGVNELLALIQQLSRDEGITVLLSSHHLHQVQQICDRVGLFVKGKLLAEGDIESLSQQLFKDEPVVIEVGVASPSEDLVQKIKDTDGVQEVLKKDGRLVVRSSQDISNQLARLILDSGHTLNLLQRKQYGLDEIYHRYFEGGEANA
jgi:ABC-2 type transport system ATP-binding protein